MSADYQNWRSSPNARNALSDAGLAKLDEYMASGHTFSVWMIAAARELADIDLDEKCDWHHCNPALAPRGRPSPDPVSGEIKRT